MNIQEVFLQLCTRENININKHMENSSNLSGSEGTCSMCLKHFIFLTVYDGECIGGNKTCWYNYLVPTPSP